MERSLVQYGTTAIPYAIQRSNRRKTVHRLDPDRGSSSPLRRRPPSPSSMTLSIGRPRGLSNGSGGTAAPLHPHPRRSS